jgi:hypothetical protein
MIAKQQIVQAMEALPDDATVEDAMDRLYLLYKIDIGLRQVAEGKVVSHEEMKKRFAQWLR